MLSSALSQELNKQIQVELESAYVYMSMAAYFESRSLDGFAHWMNLQAQEEVQHGMKIYRYLFDQGAEVKLLEIPEPRSDYSSIRECFEVALEQEKSLVKIFNNLSEIARGEKDNTTLSFLEWFLTEQVEEIATVSGILDKLKLVGEDGYGVLMLNNEFGQRQPGVEE